ncbi:MAG: Hint domain-containing protein [Pseudomonadota bacterium]
MAQFSVFALEELNITVSGDEQLSGISQGDGSHLVGETITLNNNAFVEVLVDDSDDTNFADNDSSQTLDGAQTFNGTTFANGLRVEFEFELTVTDGTDTYTLVAFNINEPGVTSFATVEGLAFVGGEGEFPPIGVPLTVTASREGPSVPFADLAFPPCFAKGTLIRTASGLRPIETIRRGDLVWTADCGHQPVTWIGSSPVQVTGHVPSPFDPVWIAPDAFGPRAPMRPLRVTQHHRILIQDWRAELLFGEPEVLVPAKALVNGTTVQLERASPGLTYWHLLFDGHQLVESDGLISESFDPGVTIVNSMERAARDELIALFPQLARGQAAFNSAARATLSVREGRALEALRTQRQNRQLVTSA